MATTRVIDLYQGGPVADALGILRERYHLAITYQDPIYICPCDLANDTSVRDAHVGKPGGPKLIVPQRRKLHFEYSEVSGAPQEDVTALVGRMLSEFAAQGGTVFEVRERAMAKGTEWNVVPVKSRDGSGNFVNQPDILGASVYLPKARRSESEFLDALAAQLTSVTGYHVVAAYFVGGVTATVDIGAENIPARDVLSNLYGLSEVWELKYAPGDQGKFVLNITPTPGASLLLKPTPAPLESRRPGSDQLGASYDRSLSPQAKIELQSKLAQGGYYTGLPNGQWDQKTVDALKKFQAANNLPVTGRLNAEIIHKLGLVDFPEPQPH